MINEDCQKEGTKKGIDVCRSLNLLTGVSEGT